MTDNGAELLGIIYEYKVKKMAEGIDWESINSKYDVILEAFREALPLNSEALSFR